MAAWARRTIESLREADTVSRAEIVFASLSALPKASLVAEPFANGLPAESRRFIFLDYFSVLRYAMRSCRSCAERMDIPMRLPGTTADGSASQASSVCSFQLKS
jgi:hypothetical protein